jgi:fluoride exporter
VNLSHQLTIESYFALHHTEVLSANQASFCGEEESMGMSGFIAVGVGAAFGAWARWGLGLLLNHLHPAVPLGTLAVNLIGGYLIGVTMALVSENQTISPEMRLLITTGFLGSLTTFSTFSIESFDFLSRAQYGWASAHILAHLMGSLVMTALGFLTIQWMRP